VRQRLALAAAFVGCAARYWLTIFPRVVAHAYGLRVSAARIPDPALRALALQALAKRGNLEGAAAFAALAPGAQRRELVRGLVSFQALYNHLDLLAEQPSPDAVADARRLHEVLLAALDVDAVETPVDLGLAGYEDDGYLVALVKTCRLAVRQLPSYPAIASRVHGAGGRIVAFQSLSLGEKDALEGWADTQLAHEGLMWWEAAAAAGSSLAVFALLAAAAEPSLGDERAAAIEAAYFPWIGALNSLLDSLVDEQEDALSGHLRLLGCYPSREQAAAGMRELTTRALAAARALPDGPRHVVLVAAMACNYLSAAEASRPCVSVIAEGVLEELGALAVPTLLIFRTRDLAGRAAGVLRGLVGSLAAERSTGTALGNSESGVDARAT
jgi:tetraprenyl-beta-curcumene synthase